MKRILLLCILLSLAPLATAQQSMDQRVAEMQKTLGDAYRARRDEQRKIVILSDLPEKAVDGYLERLRLYEDALHAAFFEHLPDYWILVVIPANAEDYNQ